MIRNLWPIWIMFFYVLFCNIVKINHFLCHFIILLHLISSFSFIKYLFVPYAYLSIEWIDCILLPLLELKAILLFSSVKPLCHSLLNLYCVCNINWMVFNNFSWSFLRLSRLVLFFSRINNFLNYYFIIKLSCF